MGGSGSTPWVQELVVKELVSLCPFKASPREVKAEEKSPASVAVKTVKKEPEDRQMASKSPYNG